MSEGCFVVVPDLCEVPISPVSGSLADNTMHQRAHGLGLKEVNSAQQIRHLNWKGLHFNVV